MTEWKFYREPGAEPIIATPERWAWVSLYSDGTFLEQFGHDGLYHQFKEIDQDRLIGFRMINLLGTNPSITLHWSPGRKLIHFCRTTIFNHGTPNEATIRLICFGYETKTDKVLFAIMPDDSLRCLDDLEKLEVKV